MVNNPFATLFEMTHHMALLPVLWLGALAFYGQRRNALTWTVAIVLGLSWIADTAAHWVDPWIVSRAYPLVQAFALGVVLQPRIGRLALVLASAGMLSLTTVGPDLVTHTVAWASIVLMLWPATDPLRRAVALTFAGMWLGWATYTVAPGWWSWGLYQGIRALGLGAFCWATVPKRVRA